jgi:hypothetical protein
VALPTFPPVELPAGNESEQPAANESDGALNADGLLMPALPPIVPPTFNGAVQNLGDTPNDDDDESTFLATRDSRIPDARASTAPLSPESTLYNALLQSPFKGIRPLLADSPESIKENSLVMPSSTLGATSSLTSSSKTIPTDATPVAKSPMEESSKHDMSTEPPVKVKKSRAPHVADINEISCTATFHEQVSSYKEEINNGYLKFGFFFHARSCHVCKTAITKVGVRKPAFYCMHCRNHFLCNTCFGNNLMINHTQI